MWGVPLAPEFFGPLNRRAARGTLAARFALDPSAPIVLVSGGSEALGRPDEIAGRLLALERLRPQVIVLAGRNEDVRRRCESFGNDRLRVMGWTSAVRELMEAADVMVTKPGHTFDEAIATELPMVVLPPPPGSEQVQYRLLEEWGVGRAVRTLDEMADAVTALLDDPAQLDAHRVAAARHRDGGAAARIASWIADQVDREGGSFVEERTA
jgi:processive 1,2-diacylglycerol beta-glucosyltransferase